MPRQAWALPLAWLASLGGLGLALGGLRLGSDSQRYIDGAQHLLSGQPLEGKEAAFIGYEALLALASLLGGGPGLVIAAQWILALAAAWLLWRAGEKVLGPQAGLVCALGFLLWPDLMRWNYYLLSDGPYASLLGICLALALLAAWRPGYGLALAPAVLWLGLLRPEGSLFALPLAAYLAVKGRGLVGGLLALGCLAVYWLSNAQDMAGQSDLASQLELGTIIWDQPAFGPSPRLSSGLSQTALIVQALARDPVWLCQVLARRWFWFLAHGRVYYSWLHNVWTVGSSLALYLGLALAWAREWRRWPELGLPTLVFALQFGFVALSWADYDGRCLTRVTPALLMLAGAAWSSWRQGRQPA